MNQSKSDPSKTPPSPALRAGEFVDDPPGETAPAQEEIEPGTFHLGAAVMAWLLPGLGHYAIGEYRRGAILLVAIGTLWVTGLLIGGISVFDHTDHKAWFIPQALISQAVVADRIFQRKFEQRMPRDENHSAWSYEPSFGRVNEQAILYTALAGLLNLLAILDVGYRDGRTAQRRQHGGTSASPRAMIIALAITVGYAALGWGILAAAGYSPLSRALPLDDYWMWLPIPLVVAISLVYRTSRLDDLTQLPRQTASLAVQIMLFMVLAAVGLWLLTELV